MSNSDEWRMTRMEGDIKEIKECITKLPETLEKKYTTKIEFTPVRTLVYGLVGIILTSFFLYLLKMLMGPLR